MVAPVARCVVNINRPWSLAKIRNAAADFRDSAAPGAKIQARVNTRRASDLAVGMLGGIGLFVTMEGEFLTNTLEVDAWFIEDGLSDTTIEFRAV